MYVEALILKLGITIVFVDVCQPNKVIDMSFVIRLTILTFCQVSSHLLVGGSDLGLGCNETPLTTPCLQQNTSTTA